jgi:hypothetical protein
MRKQENASWAPPWIPFAIFMATYVALLLLPLVFGGKREDPFFSYKIMWLNLLGHHYGLPPETPKPLFAALCGILWHAALYPVMCAFTAGVLWLLMKLAAHFGAPYWAGLAAFLLFLFCNTTVLPEFILPAYYPMLYFFVLLGGVYSFIKKRPVPAALFLLAAGLLRPEAWVVPVLVMLVSRFRRERGFSWWYVLALAAPLVWALFDLRISGSATYSGDVTQDYMASLMIAPVTFAGFWPATLDNVISSFFWPVHLAGLAGLCYFVIRKRTDDHLLMAALFLLPFMAFWFLSLAKPVIVHVRFLSFPMLLCCLYLTVAMAEWIKSKLIYTATFIALLNLGFRHEVIKTTVLNVMTDTMIEDTRKKILGVLRKLEKSADVIICGRSLAYFSYYLGEEASGRIFLFREVAANNGPLRCASKGIVVFIPNDLGSSDVVELERLMSSRSQLAGPYEFARFYKTAKNTGFVYLFQRKKDRPLPQDCPGYFRK